MMRRLDQVLAGVLAEMEKDMRGAALASAAPANEAPDLGRMEAEPGRAPAQEQGGGVPARAMGMGKMTGPKPRQVYQGGGNVKQRDKPQLRLVSVSPPTIGRWEPTHPQARIPTRRVGSHLRIVWNADHQSSSSGRAWVRQSGPISPSISRGS